MNSATIVQQFWNACNILRDDGMSYSDCIGHLIPWLKRLRDEAGERIHFWPFDGWQPARGKSVVAEVYPSIFRNRYTKEGRTADEQDAYAAARWITDMDARGALADYFASPLTDLERATAEREGWILGVA